MRFETMVNAFPLRGSRCVMGDHSVNSEGACILLETDVDR
jgi:hypothetical protein